MRRINVTWTEMVNQSNVGSSQYIPGQQDHSISTRCPFNTHSPAPAHTEHRPSLTMCTPEALSYGSAEKGPVVGTSGQYRREGHHLDDMPTDSKKAIQDLWPCRPTASVQASQGLEQSFLTGLCLTH